MAAKRKKPPQRGGAREGAGHPRRAEGATSNFTLRLTDLERFALQTQAERFGRTETAFARDAVGLAIDMLTCDHAGQQAIGCSRCGAYLVDARKRLDPAQWTPPELVRQFIKPDKE